MTQRKRRQQRAEKQQPPEMTRKEYLRHRKDLRERRALVAVLAPVLVVVVLIVLVGAYRELFQKQRTPVASVNGETITAAQFVDRLVYERRQLINNVASLASMLQSTDPATVSQLFESQRTGIGDATVSVLVDEALIRQEAANRGIAVASEDIARKIDDDLATQIAPPPTAVASDIEVSEGITVTQGITATDDITSAVGITGTDEITDTLTADAPSRDDLDKAYRDRVQPFLDQTGLRRGDFEHIVRQQLYREKLTEAIGAEIPITDKQVEAEYLVFSNSTIAQEAVDAVRGGEDWATVVARYRRPDGADAQGDEAEEEDVEAAVLTPSEEITDTVAITETATVTETLDVTEDMATPTIAATATLTPTAGAAPADEPALAPSEVLTATGSVTGTASITATESASPTPRPTITPAPTATPDPFALEFGEREWYTRDGMRDRLGMAEADADTVMGLGADEVSDPLTGGRGTYVLFVWAVEDTRDLDEAELKQRRENALEPWLEAARAAAKIDRFPLEGLLPPEPAWFTIAWEQLVGPAVPTPDLGGLDLSLTPVPAAP